MWDTAVSNWLLRMAHKIYTQDMAMWQEKAVPVTAQTIESATEWIWNLCYTAAATETSPVEAVVQAMSDQTIEAVYFFATGDGPAGMREILHQKLADSPCPVHTVSFNAKKETTIQFLKELAHLTAGRFHAFALMNEYNEEGTISINDSNKVDSPAPHTHRKLIGGLPPGAGVREDVFLIWCEIEEARNTLTEVQTLIMEVPQPTRHAGTEHASDYISSKKWLEKYGLKVRKLTWSDALADCAFRHTDAVVDVKGKPANENIQTDAVGGSTNTLGAIRLALADADTQAIYLLTDGRPDQPPNSIFAQVQLIQLVPIHTIAFNCEDAEANRFLYELSKKTRGRFHSYNSDVSESSDIPPFVVRNLREDIGLLRSEMEQGRNDLERVEKLHAECVLLDWYHSSKGKEARNRFVYSPKNHRDRSHTYSLNDAKNSKQLQRKKALYAGKGSEPCAQQTQCFVVFVSMITCSGTLALKLGMLIISEQ
uniref:VWFA domain-containing protein n=1 Tax=Callorhinchus milii TaxID=7868 RepID=A0A4W3JJV3_CALMI